MTMMVQQVWQVWYPGNDHQPSCSGSVATLTGSEANSGIRKIGNQFIGILAGLIGSTCYNKFKGTRLPDALSFFSGKRCVAIVTAVVSIVAAYSVLRMADRLPALVSVVRASYGLALLV